MKKVTAKKQTTHGKVPSRRQAKQRARTSDLDVEDAEESLEDEDGHLQPQREHSKVSKDSDIEEVGESVSKNSEFKIKDEGDNTH